MANRQIDELTYASTITDATSIPVNNNTATYEAQQLTVGKLGDFLGSRASAVHNLGDVYTNNSSLVIDNPGALPAWTGEYITNANNTYPDLYTWLKTSHSELCVTRAAYDAAITADGECKYFVIDEESGSIRFPKYSYTAPEYPWIYCFNAAVPQTTTQGAEYTASLISKVSKAGDTMTGQLVMANGSNGIKFQGTNDNNYYVNFSGNTLGLSGGNANMTGHLTVNGTQDAVHINADTWGSLILQNSNIDVSTTPEANQYMGIDFRDKNNTRVGFFGVRIGSDGNNFLEIQQQGVGGLNFPKCTTRATTTSTAKSWLPAVVVQNYVNGTSWYRVYSDNWCEQGGRFQSNDATSTTVTLMKAYRDTNYLPMICMYGLNGAAQYRTFQVQTINTNSILVWNCTNGTNTCLWRCEGYI